MLTPLCRVVLCSPLEPLSHLGAGLRTRGWPWAGGHTIAHRTQDGGVSVGADRPTASPGSASPDTEASLPRGSCPPSLPGQAAALAGPSWAACTPLAASWKRGAGPPQCGAHSTPRNPGWGPHSGRHAQVRRVVLRTWLCSLQDLPACQRARRGRGNARSPGGPESSHSLSCRPRGGPPPGQAVLTSTRGQRRAGQGPSAMAALTLSWADGGHPNRHAWVQPPHSPSWMRSPRLPSVITQRGWSQEVCPTFRPQTGSWGRAQGWT